MLSPIDFSDFDSKPTIVEDISCKSPACFIGSYPPGIEARRNRSVLREHVPHPAGSPV